MRRREDSDLKLSGHLQRANAADDLTRSSSRKDGNRG
jgi:hypothetical protein